LNNLKRLESQFTEGKISKRQYNLKKRVLDDKLGTVLAADRIKKLQGKEVTEKSQKYLSEKKKEDEDTVEKEALIQKYVTNPPEAPVNKNESSGLSKGKISLLIFVVAAFFVGTGYGVYVMSIPGNNSTGSTIDVNASAFPTVNNTTVNQTANLRNTVTSTNTSVTTTPTTKTSVTTTPSKSTTGGSTGSKSNTTTKKTNSTG
jgi:hypothetical protein